VRQYDINEPLSAPEPPADLGLPANFQSQLSPKIGDSRFQFRAVLDQPSLYLAMGQLSV
jgi:hypothetical protein